MTGMSKATVLQRVIDDIAHKDLGKARDRLLSLLHVYPNDLGLRHILGRIFLELQYPREAGRFLYLVDDQDAAVQEAIKIFEKSCKDEQLYILKSLKLRGDINEIPPGYAKEKLLILSGKTRGKLGREKIPLKRTEPSKVAGIGGAVVGVGCLLIITIAVLIGLFHISVYLNDFFRSLFH